MSRRNPTKYQRKEIRRLMEHGLSYEQAIMKIPKSQPDPRCGGNFSIPAELTNKPKPKNIPQKSVYGHEEPQPQTS